MRNESNKNSYNIIYNGWGLKLFTSTCISGFVLQRWTSFLIWQISETILEVIFVPPKRDLFIVALSGILFFWTFWKKCVVITIHFMLLWISVHKLSFYSSFYILVKIDFQIQIDSTDSCRYTSTKQSPGSFLKNTLLLIRVQETRIHRYIKVSVIKWLKLLLQYVLWIMIPALKNIFNIPRSLLFEIIILFGISGWTSRGSRSNSLDI